jgi:exodeoxyribonuclease V alpha subunit
MSLEALALLQEANFLRPVDVHFARQLVRHADSDPDAIALLAALLSVELGRGHVCVELGALDGKPFAGFETELAPRLDAARLGAALRAEPRLCAHEGAAEPRPLVRDGDRVYLHRYWLSECRVAARLRALAARRIALEEGSRELLHRLYPDAATGASGQKLACAMALTRALGVISGGPGTGKTTTVARLLVLLAAEARAAGRRIAVKLAAPTGKAAARVSEALARELDALETEGLLDADLRARLPVAAQTLHRLLGAGAGRRFAHDAANPLAADVVVLDESSMVDLRLLDALLAALPAHARLLMLGDRDQLAAVEAGNVFGALCGRDDGPGAARAAELSALTGLEVAPGPATDDAVADAIAVLRHSYRFAASSGIGRLAAAVNAGDAPAAATVLAQGCGDLGVIACGERLAPADLARLREGYRPLLSAARAGADGAALVRLQESFRVLCALREGDHGVAGINRALAQVLADAGLADRGRTHYAGRPLIVTRNDHGLRLYNGDLGIVVEDEDGHPQVLFAQPGGGVRRVPAARLPAHETAYALTVHKSQGSEFDEVVLVLPPAQAAGEALAGRELLYTAITRARRRLELALPGGVLEPRWLRASEYRSGLGDRLAPASQR